MSRGAGQDLTWAAEPDRGRKGSVRQCRARQDKIEPGGVDHGRTGSVGWNWARPTMSELSSVGQDSDRQSETEQHQSAPVEAEKDRAGRQKVGQC